MTSPLNLSDNPSSNPLHSRLLKRLPQQARARPIDEIVITTGEPAGIGPEIVIAALLDLALSEVRLPTRYAVMGDQNLLAERANGLGKAQAWQRLLEQGQVRLIPIDLAQPCKAGCPDPGNAGYVLAMLDAAIHGCLAGDFCAMVTAPIQKSTIAAAGVSFSGHTEYLAQCSDTDVDKVVMMLMGPQVMRADRAILRVALATIHLPLAAVPTALTYTGLIRVLQTIDHDLRKRFHIAAPRILVAGLNPHAGEGGLLGKEESEIIQPAIAYMQSQGINVVGPLPADTLFQPRYLDQTDCVLAMYHDQGLAPLKYATFGYGSNVTLGLPFVRTSVDHGTALDLVGTGQASYTSMLAALGVAREMSA